MNGKWFSWVNSVGEQCVVNTDHITFIGWDDEEDDVIFELAGSQEKFCLTPENHARLLKTIGIEHVNPPKGWLPPPYSPPPSKISDVIQARKSTTQ